MMGGLGVVNNLDLSFLVGCEDGSVPSVTGRAGGSIALRNQHTYLLDFMSALPFATMAPDYASVKSGIPTDGRVGVLSKTGEVYGVFVQGGSSVNLTLDLPANTYTAAWYDTKNGQWLAQTTFSHGGGNKSLSSPSYNEDIALKIQKGSQLTGIDMRSWTFVRRDGLAVGMMPQLNLLYDVQGKIIGGGRQAPGMYVRNGMRVLSITGMRPAGDLTK
jgi:hypothetical protein